MLATHIPLTTRYKVWVGHADIPSMRRHRSGSSSIVTTQIAPAISSAPKISSLVRRGFAVRAETPRPVAVSFTGPRTVGLVEEDVPVLLPGTVRVRTIYSGISAGT